MGFIGFHKGWYRVSRYKVYDLGSCEDSVRVLSGYSFFMRSLRVVRCCSSGFITLKSGVGVLHGRAALGLGG